MAYLRAVSATYVAFVHYVAGIVCIYTILFNFCLSSSRRAYFFYFIFSQNASLIFRMQQKYVQIQWLRSFCLLRCRGDIFLLMHDI